jgi:hypothetical protein
MRMDIVKMVADEMAIMMVPVKIMKNKKSAKPESAPPKWIGDP